MIILCNIIRQNFTSFVSVFILCLLFMIPSCFAPWGNILASFDTEVYYLCGKWMNEGLVMYKDIFDHKGPLLYLYNAFALRHGGELSLWLFDSLLIFIGTFFLYRLYHLVFRKNNALLLCALTLWFMNGPFAAGTDGPETLPFVVTAISIYGFAKCLIQETLPNRLICFVTAVCWTVCILCKPNTAAAITIIELYYIIKILQDKTSGRQFCGFILLSVCGFLTAFIPVFVYLFFHNSVQDCWNSYILYNFSDYSKPITFLERIAIIAKVSVSAIVGYALYICAILSKNQGQVIVWITVLFLFSCFLEIWGFGYGFRHYVIPMVPVFGLLLVFSKKFFSKHRNVRIAVISYIVVYGFANCAYRIEDGLSDRQYPKYESLSEYVVRNTTDHDKIFVYNQTPYYYILTGRQPACRYFYPFPENNPSDYEKSVRTDIETNKPRYIICSSSDNGLFEPMGYIICDKAPSNCLKRIE